MIAVVHVRVLQLKRRFHRYDIAAQGLRARIGRLEATHRDGTVMANALRSSEKRLAEGRIWPLRRARGYRIACAAGELWVTIDGALDDIFLAPGETLVIPNDGRVVVYAVRDSAFRLVAPVTTAGRQGWWAALRNAFA